MAPNPTVSELRKAAEITNDEIDAAAYAYLANPKAAPFRFSSGHEIDLAAAIDAYPPAVATVADPDRTPKFKWTMVGTAILLAHPVKG
jgi:hypothetical protein